MKCSSEMKIKITQINHLFCIKKYSGPGALFSGNRRASDSLRDGARVLARANQKTPLGHCLARASACAPGCLTSIVIRLRTGAWPSHRDGARVPARANQKNTLWAHVPARTTMRPGSKPGHLQAQVGGLRHGCGPHAPEWGLLSMSFRKCGSQSKNPLCLARASARAPGCLTYIATRLRPDEAFGDLPACPARTE
jgi:hypothetical protein